MSWLTVCYWSVYTRWFKYDQDKLCLIYTQIVLVIFEPPCILITAGCQDLTRTLCYRVHSFQTVIMTVLKHLSLNIAKRNFSLIVEDLFESWTFAVLVKLGVRLFNFQLWSHLLLSQEENLLAGWNRFNYKVLFSMHLFVILMTNSNERTPVFFFYICKAPTCFSL
jgi:hypothetical protein